MVYCSTKTVKLGDFWVGSWDRPSDFYSSSWQRGHWPLPQLLVRLVLAAVTIGFLTWSVIESPKPQWTIFLTNWGLVLLNLMTINGLVVSVVTTVNKPYDLYNHDESSLPWYTSLYWLIFNVTISITFVITALYWFLLFNPEHASTQAKHLFWLDVSTHGFNSFMALAELIISRTPVRLHHIYQPLGLGMGYVSFSAIYQGAGGRAIYEVLNWEKATEAGVVVVGAFCGLIVIYCFVWFIAFLRDKVTNKLFRANSHNLPYTPSENEIRANIV